MKKTLVAIDTTELFVLISESDFYKTLMANRIDDEETFALEVSKLVKSICAKFASVKDDKVAIDVRSVTNLLKELLLTPKPLDKKPTIAELEKLLNSEEGRSLGMLPDGEIATLNPRISIEDISKAIYARFASPAVNVVWPPLLDENVENICERGFAMGQNNGIIKCKAAHAKAHPVNEVVWPEKRVLQMNDEEYLEIINYNKGIDDCKTAYDQAKKEGRRGDD